MIINKIVICVATVLILGTLFIGHLASTKDYDYSIGAIVSNGNCKGMVTEYNEKLGDDMIEVRNAICRFTKFSIIYDYAKNWKETE